MGTSPENRKSLRAAIRWMEAILQQMKDGCFSEVSIHDEQIYVAGLPNERGWNTWHMTGERRVNLILRQPRLFEPVHRAILEVMEDAIRSRQEDHPPDRLPSGR